MNVLPRAVLTQPTDQSCRHIPLTRGQIAIVDEQDYLRLSAWNWQAHWNPNTGSYYASRGIKEKGKPYIRVIMAREIMCASDGLDVDHRDHNTLDNRRQNLRIATRSQNSINRRVRADNKAGIKGVGWDKRHGKWRARIVVDGRRWCLGRFDSIDAAVAAYSDAAIKYHGEFACIQEATI